MAGYFIPPPPSANPHTHSQHTGTAGIPDPRPNSTKDHELVAILVNRTRRGHTPENLAILRRMAMNILS